MIRFLMIFLMLFSPIVGYAETGSLPVGDNTSGTNVRLQSISKTDLNIAISSLDYKRTAVDGAFKYRISLPVEFGQSVGAFTGPGNSVLPTITRLIAVPFDSDPTLRITKANYVELNDISLAEADSEEAGSFQYSDKSINSILEQQIVIGSIAGQMRDVRIYAITIAPVQYDAERSVVRVYDDIEIEVDHAGSRITYDGNQISEAFMPIYRAVLDNPAVFDPIHMTRGAYWIIYPDEYLSYLQEFANWKKSKGFPIEFIPKSAIGSNPPYSVVKSYIQTRFDTCSIKPDYIVITSDVSAPNSRGIATKEYANPYGPQGSDIESDNYYTFLLGNDYFPDAFIGRISIDNITELGNYVSKLFTYERTPYMSDTSWYKRATVVAGSDGGSFISPRFTKLWCRDVMLQSGYTQVDTFFTSWYIDPAEISATINDGVSFVNYRGYGYADSWTPPNYGVNEIMALSNGPKFPIMTSIVCATGDYQDIIDICMGEAWIRQANRGGAGFIGNSNHYAYVTWTNAIDVGIYWGLFYEHVVTLAQSELMGKMNMYNVFPGDRAPGGYIELYFNSYNDLGDPEINCWTAVPKRMTAVRPDTIQIGQNAISAQVLDSNGQPLRGAYVCAWKGTETFAGDFTGTDGNCVIGISPSTAGTMKFTVTAQGYIPILDSVICVNNSVTVSYQSHAIDDDSTGNSRGNNDGIANPSETIELPVTLQNYGISDTAYNVAATIASESPFVEITRSSAQYSNIAPGQTGVSSEPYIINIRPDAPNGINVPVLMNISDASGNHWSGQFRFPIVAAALTADSIFVIDNGNGRIDPNETFDLIVGLRNTGGQAILSPQAILRTNDRQVNIIDSVANYSDCSPGSRVTNTEDRFTVSVSQDIYVGHVINFVLEINGIGPQTVLASFEATVGLISRSDPMGPDNYGYYCFDNSDSSYSYHPDYSWVPIDNLTWNYVTLQDDYSETISLPFDVMYYGRSYSNISICDNGFVALGNSWWSSFYNCPIPAPQNAQAMIAPYWDDFEGNNLRVYYHYDEPNSRFIIGWKNAMDQDNLRLQTFEIIFLDEPVWPTLTGDNDIIFQYNLVQSPTTNSVGICSPDRRDGIGYLFNGTYSPGAANLANGRAIKFTTGSRYITGMDDNGELPDHFSLSQNYPNPFNPTTSINFSLPSAQNAKLEIFNILGQKVATLLNAKLSAGNHSVEWDASGQPSGLYFYRLNAESKTETKRMTLLK